MVVRVVADVAGAVGLLDAADAVLQARRARDGPRPGQRLGVAQVGQELPLVARAVGLGGELDAAGRAGRSTRAPATARSRWPGSRRTAGTPACGRSARSARPRSRRRSSRRVTAAATIGTGASPLRPYIACSRSDCSVLVGRPVDGPPRWMSQMISGSSSDTARPIVSPLSAMPGPDDVVTASAPPNAAPMAAPMPAISSSAWKVRTPKRLCLLSSCRMSLTPA